MVELEECGREVGHDIVVVGDPLILASGVEAVDVVSPCLVAGPWRSKGVEGESLYRELKLLLDVHSSEGGKGGTQRVSGDDNACILMLSEDAIQCGHYLIFSC